MSSTVEDSADYPIAMRETMFVTNPALTRMRQQANRRKSHRWPATEPIFVRVRLSVIKNPKVRQKMQRCAWLNQFNPNWVWKCIVLNQKERKLTTCLSLSFMFILDLQTHYTYFRAHNFILRVKNAHQWGHHQLGWNYHSFKSDHTMWRVGDILW
jgi:hypothetical protein